MDVSQASSLKGSTNTMISSPLKPDTNAHNEWDKVAVRGKIANITEPTKVGKNQLNLATVAIVDQTGTIPIDLWETHINDVIEGHSYQMSSLQVRIWSGRKKLATTLKTEIKAINDEKFAKIEVSQTKKSAKETVVIKEITAIPKCDKFQRCPKCTKKIPQTTYSRIAKCHKCGIMKEEKCKVGLFLTVTVETTEKEQSLHLNNEILSSILKHDVSSTDESAIAEELLFVENIAVTYDVDSLVVSHVEHTSAASSTK